MNHKLKYKQRTAKSLVKPIIFIFLELLLFALVIYSVLEINYIPLTTISIVGSIYYLGTSSMPRFTKVVKRQKAFHRLKKHNIVTKKEKY